MIIRTTLALAVCAAAANAELVTYRYSGTVSTNTYWSGFHGDAIELSLTIETGTAASSSFANQAIYQNAVVDGYFQIGETRFNIADNPTVNNVNVRTGVYDQFTDSYTNRYQISVSSDGMARDGWEFPANIRLWVTDKNTPADTVLDTGLLQPLDTISTPLNGGGIDSIVASLGVIRGVASTITSGDGSISVLVPAPAAGIALLGGVAATRRRR